MSLTLLYGSSVSLRTEQLCRELIRSSLAFPERSFIMLVPEQASLSAQQDLVRLHPRHALTNVDVLTFNRLAYRVFEDLAEPGKHMIDDSGKMMLLRLVLEQQKDRLKVLKRSLGKPGFTDEVKSVITELAEYNISARSYIFDTGDICLIALLVIRQLRLEHKRRAWICIGDDLLFQCSLLPRETE